ncbi:RNA polymerase sigma factor [Paraflavitalea soli]|nr:sigma factor [Paraflavitalea soli]
MDYQTFTANDAIALQLRADNIHAYQFILDQFSPALCFFATRLTGDEWAAAHITEQVALKLWDERKRFYSVAAIRDFLYASARDGCFRFVKKHQSHLKDDLTWLAIWQKTEGYIQCEIIRAEVLRQVSNNIEHLPCLRIKLI